MSSALPATGPPPLPYTEPEWAAVPSRPWSFEVVKSGVIVDRIPAHSLSYLTVGRLPRPHCAIDLQHPSTSRYHAVLQFSRDGQLFVYDLGSTHGTWLNKQPVPPKTHTRVFVGDLLSFGSSSRVFVVHGPQDQERMAPDDESSPPPLPPHVQHEQHEQHQSTTTTSWGMAPDHDDRPSSPGSNHSHDLGSDMIIPHSAPWAKDPRKALADWLDARGLALEFEYAQESSLLSDPTSSPRRRASGGGGQLILARLHIPLDADDPTLATTHVTGEGSATRKRDAERLAMLQVLAHLDSLGLLATRAGESAASARVRRLLKEADGESDGEHEFFDRTKPDVHDNKKKRKEKPVVETFESLSAKLLALQARRDEVLRELEDLQAQPQGQAEDDDELDAYMRGLDRAQVSAAAKVKERELQEVVAEVNRAQQLVEIARPAASTGVPPRSPVAAKRDAHHGNAQQTARPKGPATLKRPMAEHAGAANPPSSPKRARTTTPPVAQLGNPARPHPAGPRSLARDMGMDVEAEMESDDDQGAQLTRQEKSVDWVPPKGQSGDGKTALNDKLGY